MQNKIHNFSTVKIQEFQKILGPKCRMKQNFFRVQIQENIYTSMQNKNRDIYRVKIKKFQGQYPAQFQIVNLKDKTNAWGMRFETFFELKSRTIQRSISRPTFKFKLEELKNVVIRNILSAYIRNQQKVASGMVCWLMFY